MVDQTLIGIILAWGKEQGYPVVWPAAEELAAQLQQREMLGDKDMAVLCHFVLGHTPGRNTQTPEEVEITLEHIDAIAREYLGQDPLPASTPEREVFNLDAGAIALTHWHKGVRHKLPVWEQLTEESRDKYRDQARSIADVWRVNLKEKL